MSQFYLYINTIEFIRGRIFGITEKKHIRFHRIKLQLVIPSWDIISALNIDLNSYSDIFFDCNTITVLSLDMDSNIITNSFKAIKNRSDITLEI